MSARDDLRDFEREWQQHIVWRKSGPAATYVAGNENGPQTISLPHVPAVLRVRLRDALEMEIVRFVDRLQADLHQQLVQEAIDEARETLAELEPKGKRKVAVKNAKVDVALLDETEREIERGVNSSKA